MVKGCNQHLKRSNYHKVMLFYNQKYYMKVLVYRFLKGIAQEIENTNCKRQVRAFTSKCKCKALLT